MTLEFGMTKPPTSVIPRRGGRADEAAREGRAARSNAEGRFERTRTEALDNGGDGTHQIVGDDLQGC